ncbi:MAG: 16S rRNA methyltransferase [Acidobacteria bacterium]|nr:MAG: 16S rRNA methyltransferase [Acidobacteriota bacterium]
MRRRFFVDAFTGGSARLIGDAAHHLGRVLRAEPGQLYELSDGSSVFLARIERVSNNRIDFALLEKLAAPSASLEIVVLLAIVKFDRFEWALEKATELGVNTIVPLAAERSEKVLVSAAAKRAVRWRKILLESAQQARCLRPPALQGVTRPAPAFAENAASVKVLFSERSRAVPLQAVFKEAASKGIESIPLRIAVAIGPEGGWADKEFDAGCAAGFREALLGKNILRTETALIAGLAAAHLYFERDFASVGQVPEQPGRQDRERAGGVVSHDTGASRGTR